jgi:hypothetical protein
MRWRWFMSMGDLSEYIVGRVSPEHFYVLPGCLAPEWRIGLSDPCQVCLLVRSTLPWKKPVRFTRFRNTYTEGQSAGPVRARLYGIKACSDPCCASKHVACVFGGTRSDGGSDSQCKDHDPYYPIFVRIPLTIEHSLLRRYRAFQVHYLNAPTPQVIAHVAEPPATTPNENAAGLSTDGVSNLAIARIRR